MIICLSSAVHVTGWPGAVRVATQRVRFWTGVFITWSLIIVHLVGIQFNDTQKLMNIFCAWLRVKMIKRWIEVAYNIALFPGFPAFGGRAQKHSGPTQNQILEIAWNGWKWTKNMHINYGQNCENLKTSAAPVQVRGTGKFNTWGLAHCFSALHIYVGMYMHVPS